MEQLRLLIAIVLSFLVFFLWNLFFVEQAPVQKKTKSQEISEETKEPETRPVEMEKQPASERTEISRSELPLSTETEPAKILSIHTPLYTIRINEKGAVVDGFELKKYHETAHGDSPLKELVSMLNGTGTLQTQLFRRSLTGFSEAVYRSDLDGTTVQILEEPQKINFFWDSPEGIRIIKSFTFLPKSYLFGMDFQIENRSGRVIEDQFVFSLRKGFPEGSGRFGFQGPSFLLDGSMERVKIKDIEDQESFNGEVSWVALQDRYFMQSIILDTDRGVQVRLKEESSNIVESQVLLPETVIEPGESETFRMKFFMGPKSIQILSKIGFDLDRAVNFGMFDFIAKPCLWLMNYLYRFIPNYGVAIIILTLITKILLWPLGSKSYKSMNEMKRIQPLMTEIREKYKNDKQRMNQEMMGLYKTYKINPLGGCLPMFAQIPVFFALYRMLYEAIELRHAPFFGWINDLSAPDRLFRFDFSIPLMEPPYGIPVLTIIMGAAMLLQQKMSPPPGDPTQAKMMMFMPIVFTVIFINFSSGLVLYWLVNQIVSVAQQYYISKKNA